METTSRRPVLRGPVLPGPSAGPGMLDFTGTSRLSLQETGLYYKKFLAYPWILTIMWPEKLVTPVPLFKNGVVLGGFPACLRQTEPGVAHAESPARGGRPDC